MSGEILKNNKMSDIEIKHKEQVLINGPKSTAKKYRLKIADLGYLGYKENKDKYMEIVEKDKAQVLYKSPKSHIYPKYYTYAFYPNGSTKHGLSVDFKLNSGRRIFGNTHDTAEVSWAVKDNKLYAISKGYSGLRLWYNEECQLIATFNGGYDVELEEIK